MDAIFAQIGQLLQSPWIRAALVVVGSAAVAFLAELIIVRVLMVVARRTSTELDDAVIAALRRPIFYTLLLFGLAWAVDILAAPTVTPWHLSPGAARVIYGALKSVGVVMWTIVGVRIASLLLRAVSQRGGERGIVQPRTLPAFDIMAKLLVIAIGVYFALVAWNVDVSGWLASAGVLGIVVGLAAKDTLANLFAGIFILADAPYKLGDVIVLDGGLRGRVREIGMRSTRILTLEDIEITVPNALIGNSKIINETGGPWEKARVAVVVEAAYGSDIDKVREVLLRCADGVEHVCTEPPPRVRFREFGGSGLGFELRVWIREPMVRDMVLDLLNVRVYKAFDEASIEIPYSKHDVYIKQMAQGEAD